MPVVKGVVQELINHLLESEKLEPEDFDAEEAENARDMFSPPDPKAVNISDDIWKNDALLRKAFTWLTKCQLGPKFGSMPIHYYQQDQIKALDKLKAAGAKKGINLRFVRWRNGNIQGFDEAKGKWVTIMDSLMFRYESLEDFDDEELDSSLAHDVKEVDAPTLDDIKAAEPGFFNRKNTKLFGTKKIYKYGNFLVLKNVRKHHGHFGNFSYYTSYVIYEFVKTEDDPIGHLKCRGDAKDLQDAKEQIKLKDFRSRLERAREMIAKMGNRPVAEAEEDLDSEEADIELWKEVTGNATEVIPENPRWWRYRQESKWKVLRYPNWIVETDIFQEGRVSIYQFKRPFNSQEAYDPEQMEHILEGMIEIAARSAMDGIVIVLTPGDGYEEMQEAAWSAEKHGLIDGLRRSGMALSARILNRSNPWLRESDDDDFAEVSDIEHLSAEIPRPMRFRDVPVGGVFSNSYGNRMTKLNDEEIANDNGGRSKLGNPIFMCYPPNWNPATAKSYARKIHTFPRLKENEEDEFDADLARDIGIPDPMQNWRDHNVLRETDKYALVTFQNGKTGLICLVPDHFPDRVPVRNPSDIKYLQGISDQEFNFSACLEYGCGVWSSSDEQSEETERELGDGG